MNTSLRIQPFLLWSLAFVFALFLDSQPVPATGGAFGLAFSTFFGGSQFERAQGVAVDKDGFIYIAGNTSSPDLPTTPGTFQRSYCGDNVNGSSGDGYVAKFSPNGSQLVWATYLGGAGGDMAYNLVVDHMGSVYVTVWTSSADFPTTTGAYDTTHNSPGVMDIAYVKLKPDASGLVYSTFIGGAGTEQARGSIYDDASGCLYSSGWTDSANFPTTPGAYQRTRKGGNDAFLLKLSADGSQLVFSTLFGGSAMEYGHTGVAVHLDSTIYFAGYTTLRNLPVSPDAFQKTYGGDGGAPWGNGDGFLAKFSANGATLLFSTYLGGTDNDNGNGNNSLVIDSAGRVVLIGETHSTNFPVTPNAFQKICKGGPSNTDGFLSVLAPDLSTFLYSTFLGGAGTLGGFGDRGRAVAVDSKGSVIVTGDSNSPDFPTSPGVYQRIYRGGVDAFIAKFTNAPPMRPKPCM
jgi:hypothetical protein